MSLVRLTAARVRVVRRGFVVCWLVLVAVVALPGSIRATELIPHDDTSDETRALRDGARLRSYRHPLYYGQPRVIMYDLEQDELRRNASVTMPVLSQPRGYSVSYHGNRLKQYRFAGPSTQGGIYSALSDDKHQRDLDERKYRYRWDY